jgi:phage-related minor tail protein
MAKSGNYELAIKIAGKVDPSLKAATKAASGEFSKMQSVAKTAMKGVAVGAAAAATALVAIGTAAVNAYAEYEKAANGLAAATGATGEELEGLKDAMETVYTNNYGDSLEDVADAVALVDKNLKGLSDEELVNVTEAAFALQDAFDYSVEESSRAAAAITKNFGVSAEEAYGLIAAGAQNGLDYSGEMIDTINEYSSQFSKLGFTADGMFQLMQSGADSTAWNLDKVGDAVKEFSIRSIDGSKTTVAAFESLGYNAGEMMATFAAGGQGANDAFFEVIDTLMTVEDQVERDALGVALFGTQWEDLGTEAIQAMADASNAAYDTQDALAQINAVQYNDLESQLEGVKRQGEAILRSVGEQLMPYILEALSYVSSTLLPAVEGLLPSIMSSISALLPAISELLPIVVEFGAQLMNDIVPILVDLISAVMPTLSSLLKSLLPVVTALIQALGPILTALFAALTPVFDLLTAILPPIANIISMLTPIISLIGQLVTTIISGLAPVIQFISELIGTVLNTAFAAITPIIEGVIGIFGGLIDFITNVFSGNWSGAWQAIVDVFGNVFGTIANIAKVPINAVISGINWCIEKINGISVTVPDWVPGLGGKTFGFSIPSIPLLAEGGIATGATLAMVGEGQEPEAILPLSKLAGMLEGQSGGVGGSFSQSDTISFSPVFNFYGGVSKDEATEAGRISFAEFKRLYDQMMSENRRKNFSMA